MKTTIDKTILNKSISKNILAAGLCSSVLALAACQPASDNSEADSEISSTETNEIVTENNNPIANTDSEDESDHSNMATTEFGEEYLDSMEDMHEDMMEGIVANDADVAFAKGMLPHHEGAVEMAEIQLEYGKDETLRKLAQNIITAQEAEIDQMENWLEANPDTEEKDYSKEMQQAYKDSMQPMHDDMMQGILSEDADMAFAKGMLPHHEGAIAMAEVQLKYGKNAEMRKLAQDIIDAQKNEIELMQNWIDDHS